MQGVFALIKSEYQHNEPSDLRPGGATVVSSLDNWRQRKPSLRRQPIGWLKRKIRLKLNDIVERFGWKLTETVDFSSLHPSIQAMHIIDVGVANGTPSLYARFPEAYLDLFEPVKAFRSAIEENILSSRDSRLHPIALSDWHGFGLMIRPGTSGGVLLPSIGCEPIDRPDGQQVVVRRLDEVLSASQLKGPTLLKVDTEGTELAVLKGATNILQSIDTVVIETHFRRRNTCTPDEVQRFLANYGFMLTDVLGGEVIEGCVACLDLVFQRSHAGNAEATARPA